MSALPRPTRCPQCLSLFCGAIACRFTGLQHKHAKPPKPPQGKS